MDKKMDYLMPHSPNEDISINDNGKCFAYDGSVIPA